MTSPDDLLNDLVAEAALQLRAKLTDVCSQIMLQFEDKQSKHNRIEFGLVVYSTNGENSITLSASPAPWGLIAKALLEAAERQEVEVISEGPETLQ